MGTPQPPTASQAPGGFPQRLGKYEILRHVATGGMAELFLARATGLEGFERLVVIKRILPLLAVDPEITRMFLDEARIAATLHHSNIAQVFDIGAVDGQYFLAMEFLEGEDVSRIRRALRAARGELPLEHALNIVINACAGLHYAHERAGTDGRPLNIIHRDVSPQNIFVTYEGEVKLVDFGIAKASSRASAATQVGTVKGKIRYMSPEQARSEPLDRRSDVFSASIILWELTTGRRLFHRRAEYDVLKLIVEHDAPPPSSVKPGYPPELEHIVMKGLQRTPRARFQTARELQLALEEFGVERRMRLSPVQLSGFMHQAFGEKIAALQAARARGVALADHIAKAFEEKREEARWQEDSDLDEEPRSHTEPSVQPAVPPPPLAGPPTVYTGPPPPLAGPPTVYTGAPPPLAGAPTVYTGNQPPLAAASTVLADGPPPPAPPTVYTPQPVVFAGTPPPLPGPPTVYTGGAPPAGGYAFPTGGTPPFGALPVYAVPPPRPAGASQPSAQPAAAGASAPRPLLIAVVAITVLVSAIAVWFLVRPGAPAPTAEVVLPQAPSAAAPAALDASPAAASQPASEPATAPTPPPTAEPPRVEPPVEPPKVKPPAAKPPAAKPPAAKPPAAKPPAAKPPAAKPPAAKPPAAKPRRNLDSLFPE